jgi:hypothetical protein
MIKWLVRRQVAKALTAAEPIIAGRTVELRAPAQLAGMSGRTVQVGGVGVLVALRDELIFSLGTPSLIVRVPRSAISSIRADRSFAIKGKASTRPGVRYVIVDWLDDGTQRTIVFEVADAEGLRARLEVRSG